MKGFEAMPQKSIHFTLHELADGVYAVVANPHGAAFSNSGIIDLGDQVLVLDAMDTPTAARIIKTMIPTKLAIIDPLAIIFSSTSLPEKTQNVIQPNTGIKKDTMYTNHLTFNHCNSCHLASVIAHLLNT